MKILLVIDTYDTNNNGTSISAQRFAAVLREHGNEVKILTTGEPAPDKFALKEFKVPGFNDLIHAQGFQSLFKFQFDNLLSMIFEKAIRIMASEDSEWNS